MEIPVERVLTGVVIVTALVVIVGLGAVVGGRLAQSNAWWFDVANPNLEMNIPTWYTSVLLLGCAGMAAMLTGGALGRRESRGWLVLAVALAAMSMEEFIGLHERVSGDIREALGLSGALRYAWVIPGAGVVLIFVLIQIGFLVGLPSWIRNGLLLAGSVYVAGALGVELLEALLLSDGPRSGPQDLMALTQEVVELTGLVVLARVLLWALADRRRVVMTFGTAATGATRSPETSRRCACR